MRRQGLRTQIRTNALKSALLLAGFPLVLPAIISAVVFTALSAFGEQDALTYAAQTFAYALGLLVAATVLWLPIAYFLNQWIIDQATGARLLDRREEPRVWQLLEGLCRKAGIRMPALRLIETEAMNAFASGLSEGRYSVTVTRGLINELEDAELEAVLAHELAHIRNHDCRLLVVATILVGMIPLLHDIILRVYWALMMGCMKLYQGIFTVLNVPGARLLVTLTYSLVFLVGKVVGHAIAVGGYVCSLVIQFALSRRREFMADAGAVELTGDSDALISALERISCNSAIETSVTGVRAMLFESSLSGWGSLFDTHPAIEARIAAIRRHAAGGETSQQRERTPLAMRSARTRKVDQTAAVDGFQRLLSLTVQQGSNNREAREAVYARARQSLAALLQGRDLQLSRRERARLKRALEKAIAKNDARRRRASRRHGAARRSS